MDNRRTICHLTIQWYNSQLNKKTLIQTSQKQSEKKYIQIFKTTEIWKPNFILRDLVTTSDNRSTFSKGDSINYSYEIYKRTEVIHDTIPSFTINFSPDRYNENFLKPTIVNLIENNIVVKDLNSFQKNET